MSLAHRSLYGRYGRLPLTIIVISVMVYALPQPARSHIAPWIRRPTPVLPQLPLGLCSPRFEPRPFRAPSRSVPPVQGIAGAKLAARSEGDDELVQGGGHEGLSDRVEGSCVASESVANIHPARAGLLSLC
jgi:hypothetical protein